MCARLRNQARFEGGQIADQEVYDLFVTYAAGDRAWVERYLLPELGLPAECVITPRDFRPGATILDEFVRAVSRSRYTALVLSRAYLQDAWAAFAGELAGYISVEDQRNRLIPIRLEPIETPLDIKFRVDLDCTDEDEWTQAMARLRDVLEQPEPAPQHIECPYPGMKPFADEKHFYGRQGEVETMLIKFRDPGALFVIGPSGSGKSSLVSAGLLPTLPESEHFPPGSWLVRHLRPGAEPMSGLRRVLEGEPGQSAEVVAALLARHPPTDRLLLIIDPFEEVFAQVAPAEREEFIRALKSLRAMKRCSLLIAMRADFFGDLMNSAFWPVLLSERLEVAPLRGDELEEAIQRPAADVGVCLEPRLVERLMADAANEPGSLPLIQETMQLLWPQRRRQLLTLSAYKKLGGGGRTGLAFAVARKADAVLEQLTPEQREIARRVFVCLVQFGEGRPDTRRQQPLEALRGSAGGGSDFDRVMELLTEERLLTWSGKDETRGRLVDLSHEVLISAWPQLRSWLNDDRPSVLIHRRLTQAAEDWVGSNHDRSFLYSGPRLAEAQGYEERHGQDLSRDERDFLRASVRHETDLARSRLLLRLGRGAVLVGLAYGLSFALLSLFSTGMEPSLAWFQFVYMFEGGGLIGLAIVTGPWLLRIPPTRQALLTGLCGALASGVLYEGYVLATVPGATPDWRPLAAGAFLGAGVGLGACSASTGRYRAPLGALAGLLAAWLASVAGGLPPLEGGPIWSAAAVSAFGLILGGVSGLGFPVPSAEKPPAQRDGLP